MARSRVCWASVHTASLERARMNSGTKYRGPSHSVGIAAKRELAKGAAGVAADQDNVMEVERAKQAGDRVGDGDGRQVGVRVRRPAVGAEGPVGQDAADSAGCQLLGHGIPQRGVNEEAVDEHSNRRVGPPRPDDPVVDGTDRKIDGGHGGLR